MAEDRLRIPCYTGEQIFKGMEPADVVGHPSAESRWVMYDAFLKIVKGGRSDLDHDNLTRETYDTVELRLLRWARMTGLVVGGGFIAVRVVGRMRGRL